MLLDNSMIMLKIILFSILLSGILCSVKPGPTIQAANLHEYQFYPEGCCVDVKADGCGESDCREATSAQLCIRTCGCLGSVQRSRN